MTECQSATPEPSVASIRRSLRALAEGSDRRRVPSDATSAGRDVDHVKEEVDHDVERFEEIVDDAERALPCARTAANFLLDGGCSALDDAISTAERRGSDRVAQRGRRARSVLRDFDAALIGDAGGRSSDVATPRRSTAGDATTSAPLAERF